VIFAGLRSICFSRTRYSSRCLSWDFPCPRRDPKSLRRERRAGGQGRASARRPRDGRDGHPWRIGRARGKNAQKPFQELTLNVRRKKRGARRNRDAGEQGRHRLVGIGRLRTRCASARWQAALAAGVQCYKITAGSVAGLVSVIRGRGQNVRAVGPVASSRWPRTPFVPAFPISWPLPDFSVRILPVQSVSPARPRRRPCGFPGVRSRYAAPREQDRGRDREHGGILPAHRPAPRDLRKRDFFRLGFVPHTRMSLELARRAQDDIYVGVEGKNHDPGQRKNTCAICACRSGAARICARLVPKTP